MHYERLAAIRTVVLVLVGFGALTYAAFQVNTALGWAAVGVNALVIEFLTATDKRGT
jgi:hypothetical protein